MTKVKFNNGTVVEDTFADEREASPATEAYLWQSILKDVAYSVASSLKTEDEELSEYIDFLKTLEVEGNALGAVQAAATDFTTDEYLEESGLGTAISLADPNDTEVETMEYIGVDTLSERNQELVEKMGSFQVPTTPEEEPMPLVVASNERMEGVHSLEEAKEMWSDFLGHLDIEADATEPVTSEEKDEETSDSDGEEGLLRGAKGVGKDVSDKIRNHIIEERVTVDWRNHIDAEEWQEADTIVTEEAANERLQAVAGEMPSGAFQMATKKLGNGQIDEAIVLIADYE